MKHQTLVRKLLDGLLEEVEGISEQIKTKGIVPEEICELCKIGDKKKVVEFSRALLRFFFHELVICHNHIFGYQKSARKFSFSRIETPAVRLSCPLEVYVFVS